MKANIIFIGAPMHLKRFTPWAIGLLLSLPGLGARAEEGTAPAVRFEAERFEPAEIFVPAGAPFQLRVVNGKAEAVEFESFELNRERVVQPGQEIVVYLPALAPGTYRFFDDFHKDAGEGRITAR
jgi:hypothetical protein